MTNRSYKWELEKAYAEFSRSECDFKVVLVPENFYFCLKRQIMSSCHLRFEHKGGGISFLGRRVVGTPQTYKIEFY